MASNNNVFLQKKLKEGDGISIERQNGDFYDEISLNKAIFLTDKTIKANLTTLLELSNYETTTDHAGDIDTLSTRIDSVNNALSADTQKLKTDVATLKNTVNAITSFEYKVVKTNPTTSTPTSKDKGIIYLFKDSHSDTNDNYDEYLAVDVDGVLQWEKIGNTDVNLTNYVTKDFTIAGLDMQDNISMEELRDAIGAGTTFVMNRDGVQAGQEFQATEGTINFGYVVKGLITPGSPTNVSKFPDKDGIVDISDLSKSVKLNGSTSEKYDASSGIISIPNVVTGIKTPSGLTASNTAHTTEKGAYKGLVDLSHLVPDTRTIMGIDLKDNITTQEVADKMEAYYNSFPNLLLYKHTFLLRRADLTGASHPSVIRIVDYSTNPFYYFHELPVSEYDEYLKSLEGRNYPMSVETEFYGNSETEIKVSSPALSYFKNDKRKSDGFSPVPSMHSGEWDTNSEGVVVPYVESLIYQFGSVTGSIYDQDGDFLPVTSAFINFSEDSKTGDWTQGLLVINNYSHFIENLFWGPDPVHYPNNTKYIIFESVTPMWGNPFRRTYRS